MACLSFKYFPQVHKAILLNFYELHSCISVTAIGCAGIKLWMSVVNYSEYNQNILVLVYMRIFFGIFSTCTFPLIDFRKFGNDSFYL